MAFCNGRTRNAVSSLWVWVWVLLFGIHYPEIKWHRTITNATVTNANLTYIYKVLPGYLEKYKKWFFNKFNSSFDLTAEFSKISKHFHSGITIKMSATCPHYSECSKYTKGAWSVCRYSINSFILRYWDKILNQVLLQFWRNEVIFNNINYNVG